jgi:voltage-gated potassium channel Kch
MLFLLLKRRIQKWWSKAPWLTLSALLGTLYLTGYAMMLWQEPASNPIRSLPTYTYFFVVTVTTVGFGDVVTERNPFPGLIEFVRGEPTSADVMARACVKDASKVIIHSSTDYESISIALAVKEINPVAPIVVKANDPGKEIDIERVDRQRVVCVRSIDVPMIVREIHNPGITRVLENLLSPEGQDLQSIQVPEGKTYNFGRLAHHFREEHGAILIGMRPAGTVATSQAVLNPAFDAIIDGGMFLDYISRIPVRIEWKLLDELLAETK